MRILVCTFLAGVAFAAKPVQVVSLKSSQLEITFDPLKGLPAEYRLASNKATIRGGTASEVTTTIFRANPRRYTNFAVRPEIIRATKTRADFQFNVREKGASMASFMLRYELSGAELVVSLEAVFEEQGFELIDVGLPDLASVREEDGGAWLAHGDGGGIVAMLKNAKDGRLSSVATTLPVVMVGTNRMLCVEEVLSYMDTVELAVDHHEARLGTVKTWRVNPGNSGALNLTVGGRPLCRLNFTGDLDHNGAVDWLDGAKVVRAKMPEIPSHFYDDKVMYRIDTRADAAGIAKRVASLTGDAPQMVFRPDNFDVVNQNSPAWDSNIVARKPDGELWKTGANAFFVGMAKFMEGPGPERIRSIAEHDKPRDAYFLDGFSTDPIRNDWDRDRPASGLKNLVDGRFKVLEEFKKYGLDVVSDELRFAMLGKISVTADGPSGEVSPFGGEPIPLAATVYRKSAIWGGHGKSSLFYNSRDFPTLPYDGWERQFTDFYYGTLVPWYQIHYRNIEAYLRDGDRSVITLEGNSTLDVDWRSDQFTVTVNGTKVAGDGDTFCPIGTDRMAFYSRKGRQLSAPLPAGWDPNAVVARALTADKAEDAKVSVRDGMLTVNVQAERPVMVYRSR